MRNKLHVCWLSTIDIIDKKNTASGTWINSMAELFKSKNEDINVTNVIFNNVEDVQIKYNENLCQITLPKIENKKYWGKEKNIHTEIMIKIKSLVRADLYHIWGTESKWKEIAITDNLKPKLLEIQGVKSDIAIKYSADLNMKEILKCTGLKEIIRLRTIPQVKKKYSDDFKNELDIINKYKFIGTQSEYTRAHLKSLSPHSKLFKSRIALRKEFYLANTWFNNSSKIIFASAAYPAPFKGLHTLIRSAALIKQEIPDIEIRIAGHLPATGIKSDGYINWITSLINSLNLKENVIWLGPLSADQIVNELNSCKIFVVTSFVESYCVALAEAMHLGVPVVSSYTGGTSFLGSDEVDLLFYPPGDHEMLSQKVLRLMNSDQLRSNLSSSARAKSIVRDDIECITSNQIDIYKQVTSEID